MTCPPWCPQAAAAAPCRTHSAAAAGPDPVVMFFKVENIFKQLERDLRAQKPDEIVA